MPDKYEVKMTIRGNNILGSGYFGAICPNCMDYSIQNATSPVMRNGITKIKMICPHCSHVYNLNTIDWIDPNITKAISILNRKGYNTKFSCEGHQEEELPEAYIYFRSEEQISILDKFPLPYPWWLDTENKCLDGFVIRAQAYKCRDEDWNERNTRITEWAKSLPQAGTKTVFKYGYGSK